VASPLLTSADYPAIRAMIEIGLDATTLPDTIIALDAYIGAGMRDVLAIDAFAETREGTDLLHATTAAILFTAARLIGALPQIVKETFPDHSYERNRVDASARAAELRGQASAELDAYLDPGDTASDRPTFFTVARGYRGRW
jgi:hypothetical protein